MVRRLVTATVVLFSCSAGFSQDTASWPAIGYKDSFQVNFTNANLLGAETVLSFTNLGVHNAPPGNGDICVNIYVFNTAASLGQLRHMPRKAEFPHAEARRRARVCRVLGR